METVRKISSLAALISVLWLGEGLLQAAPGPFLAYSTYLGGDRDDAVMSMAVDPAGNLYLTGMTNSSDFPFTGTPGSRPTSYGDCFVAKLDRHGALVFSLHFGAPEGVFCTNLTLDPQGNLYVTGAVRDPGFPRVGGLPPELAGGDGDLFILKLDRKGRLVLSTRLGGSGFEVPSGIGVDAKGRIFVSGTTRSADFPVRGGYSETLRGSSDAFVVRLSPSGSAIEAGTFLGGSSDEFDVRLAVGPEGEVYATGWTWSADFPLVSPLVPVPQGSFLAKLDPSLSSLVYSTYFATTSATPRLGPAGHLLVAGTPERRSEMDACLSELSPGGALLFSRCLGGSSDDWVSAIALDRVGNIVLTGSTSSLDFPLKNPLQDRCEPVEIAGRCFPDLFVMKLDPTAQDLLFSTYLGGSQPMPALYPPDESALGLGIDGRGDLYLAGWTYSADFPAVDAFQPGHGGGDPESTGEIDGFAVHISAPVHPAGGH